jgi:hypothetical protein
LKTIAFPFTKFGYEILVRKESSNSTKFDKKLITNVDVADRVIGIIEEEITIEND